MPKISFLVADQTEHVVEINEGDTLMTGGLFGGVPGIEGICGGAMACGSCHLHIDAFWRDRLPAPGVSEREMIQGLDNGCPDSRLGCQIVVTNSLDGMQVRVATS